MVVPVVVLEILVAAQGLTIALLTWLLWRTARRGSREELGMLPIEGTLLEKLFLGVFGFVMLRVRGVQSILRRRS